jgi:hypothetical protein
MSLRDDLLSTLSRAGLSTIAVKLAELSKECVRMRSMPRTNAPIAIGTSMLGGLPDLPPGLPWPQWKTG